MKIKCSNAITTVADIKIGGFFLDKHGVLMQRLSIIDLYPYNRNNVLVFPKQDIISLREDVRVTKVEVVSIEYRS